MVWVTPVERKVTWIKRRKSYFPQFKVTKIQAAQFGQFWDSNNNYLIAYLPLWSLLMKRNPGAPRSGQDCANIVSTFSDFVWRFSLHHFTSQIRRQRICIPLRIRVFSRLSIALSTPLDPYIPSTGKVLALASGGIRKTYIMGSEHLKGIHGITSSNYAS